MLDRELIQQFQDGDNRSFDELVKRYHHQCYQFFFRMVNDPMEADDLCQETFIRVYKGLKKFRHESQFTTWLYRISVNVANSYFRKQRFMEIFTSEKNFEHISINEQDESQYLEHEIWKAIQKLPRMQRMVLILRIFQQLSFKEVAGVIGISENSAKVNYHHAINRMKELVGSD